VHLLQHLRIVATMAALFLAMAARAALPAPERVEFPSLALDAAGANVTIPALLFRPPRAAAGGNTALVVALHGCGGMFSTRRGSEQALSDSFAQWTAQLLDDGHAVLWPDSFAPRGLREVCTIRTGERTITAAARRLDALGVLRVAGTLPGIDAHRVAVVGWSHGGSTTLAAINGQDPRVAPFLAAGGAPPFFRAAVAFYPGCAPALRAGAKWRPATTTAIHIGASDDWTPAAPCVELGEAMRAAGRPLTVDVYPGAYHGFDAPSGRVAVRMDVPNGVNPGQGVTRGPDPAARAIANDRVRAFLREHLAATAHSAAPVQPLPAAGADKTIH
jgi:dienelactone hydrolase